ncbi:MAG: hypothetical protein OXC95_12380, partial [Dehalococcoidia bacterium]|nr:hypothetical protein [Dehalococcoidia bacterium]
MAKIHRRPQAGYGSKLIDMIKSPPDAPEGAIVAWPEDVLHETDSSGPVVGYVMRRVGGYSVSAYYIPKNRVKYAPWFDYELLLTAAKNIANAVQAVHDQGYVIGDINESNILVYDDDASSALISADSFYVVGDSYTGLVRRPEYTPHEMQGEGVQATADADQDLFGLAVIVYKLLMEGVHPFAGVYTGEGEPPPLEDRIAAGYFPHSGNRIPYAPPRGSPEWSALPIELRDLFVRCFEDGYYQPEKRPAAREWADAIEKVIDYLTTCPLNSQHRYFNHLSQCLWCERDAQLLLGISLFPAVPSGGWGQPPSPPLPTGFSWRQDDLYEPGPISDEDCDDGDKGSGAARDYGKFLKYGGIPILVILALVAGAIVFSRNIGGDGPTQNPPMAVLPPTNVPEPLLPFAGTIPTMTPTAT